MRVKYFSRQLVGCTVVFCLMFVVFPIELAGAQAYTVHFICYTMNRGNQGSITFAGTTYQSGQSASYSSGDYWITGNPPSPTMDWFFYRWSVMWIGSQSWVDNQYAQSTWFHLRGEVYLEADFYSPIHTNNPTSPITWGTEQQITGTATQYSGQQLTVVYYPQGSGMGPPNPNGVPPFGGSGYYWTTVTVSSGSWDTGLIYPTLPISLGQQLPQTYDVYACWASGGDNEVDSNVVSFTLNPASAQIAAPTLTPSSIELGQSVTVTDQIFSSAFVNSNDLTGTLTVQAKKQGEGSWTDVASQSFTSTYGYSSEYGEYGVFYDLSKTWTPTETGTYDVRVVYSGNNYYLAVSNPPSSTFIVEEAPPVIEVPTAPQNLEARSVVPGVSLTWEEPSDNGGEAIQNYKIYRGESSGTETFLDSVDGTTMTYTDTTVSLDNLYYYYVTASNSAGEGPASNEVKCSSLQSIKGIETVVTLNEFKTVGDYSFSIQQNFFIQDSAEPNHLYWAQNIIMVQKWFTSDGVAEWRMVGGFEIREYWYGNPPLFALIPFLIHHSLPETFETPKTVTLRSSIDNDYLLMENDFMKFKFDIKLPTGSYILVTPATSHPPEIVIVGVPNILGSPEVYFEPHTSGYVDTFVRIGSNPEVWLYGTNTVIRPPDHAATAETSMWLQWNTNGNFEDFPGWSDQGVWFNPNYEESTASPPSPPAPPSPGKTFTSDLYCPANLSLYDSLGRHVGYDETTKEVDVEIPDALYFFSDEAESIVVFNPLGEYELSVIGTGEGNYTLHMKLANETGVVVDEQTFIDEVVEGETHHYSVEAANDTLVVEPPSLPVGGIYIPVNKLELLAPYIGLTMLLAVAVVTVVYVNKRKRHRD